MEFLNQLGMNDNKVTAVATPTADSDAVNKAYVDTEISSIDTIKEINGNTDLQFWKGTKAQYDALGTKSDSVVYVKTDEDLLQSLGVTATVTELNYMDGVTSTVQTQLDNKIGIYAGTEAPVDTKSLWVDTDSEVNTGITIVPVTLSAASWSSSNYTLSDIRITTNSIITIAPSASITLAQYDSIVGAKIIEYSISDGQVVLKALGDVPTIDCPVNLLIGVTDESNIIPVTISAVSWASNDYTISHAGITSGSIVTVAPASSMTASQYDAIAGAKIIEYSISTGQLILRALGTVPTIDCPVTLVKGM